MKYHATVVSTMCLIVGMAASLRTSLQSGGNLKNHSASSDYFYFGWYGYDPTEQAGWVSLGVGASEKQLTQGRALGVPRQFWALEHQYLWSGTRDGKPGLRLIHNWKELWHTETPKYRALLNNGTISGFFLGDELMWNGFQYHQLVEWSNLIRATFPNAWIWENEAVPSYNCPISVSLNTTRTCSGPGAPCCDLQARIVSAPVIPPAISSQSIDLYRWDSGSPSAFELVKGYYKTHLVPRLSSNQSLFLVPGSAASTHNPICNLTCYEDLVSTQAWDFYNWAQEADSRITGMVPWNWNNCSGCVKFHDEIGTIAMPKARKAWKEIGEKILKANNKTHL